MLMARIMILRESLWILSAKGHSLAQAKEPCLSVDPHAALKDDEI